MKQGIYKIEHTSGKKYVGSSNNIKRRWQSHRAKLRTGKHKNQYLQRAWNKYSESAFKFEILEIVNGSQKDLLEREQWYLDKQVNWSKDYNMAKNAFSPQKGLPCSEEAKNHLRCLFRGEGSPDSILTEPQVIEILNLLLVGNATFQEIGNKYGVKSQTISSIKRGDTWGHIGGKIRVDIYEKQDRIAQEEVAKVFRLAMNNCTNQSISIAVGLSKPTVNAILENRARTEYCDDLRRNYRVYKEQKSSRLLKQTKQIYQLSLEGNKAVAISKIVKISPDAIRTILRGNSRKKTCPMASQEYAHKHKQKLIKETEIIFRLATEGKYHRIIAEEVGLSQSVVTLTLQGKVRADVCPTLLNKYLALQENKRVAIEEQTAKVYKAAMTGMTNKAIAKQLGIGVGAVGFILRGTSRKNLCVELRKSYLRHKNKLQKEQNDCLLHGVSLVARGYTREAASQIIGISPSTLSRVIQGVIHSRLQPQIKNILNNSPTCQAK